MDHIHKRTHRTPALRACALPIVRRTCEACGGKPHQSIGRCIACAGRGYVVAEDTRVSAPIFPRPDDRRAA